MTHRQRCQSSCSTALLIVSGPYKHISGNIVTGNDTQTDAVLQGNALPVLAKLLQHPKLNLVKAEFQCIIIAL